MMKRRTFLGSILLLTGAGLVKAIPHLPATRKAKLRFAVASDGHYGQPQTDYALYFRTIVEKINLANREKPFDFCVINGDIIHDNKEFFPDAKKALDLLETPYYVTRGNHDQISVEGWESIWNMPINHEFVIGDCTCFLLDTSDEKGTYLCPDVDWLQQKLEKNRHQKNVFIFMHINPAKLTQHGIMCEPLLKLFEQHTNVRAVFNGHDHQEADIKLHRGMRYIFDGHFGGSWGTDYRGFRVVELLENNDILTYLMNPDQKISEEMIAAGNNVLN